MYISQTHTGTTYKNIIYTQFTHLCTYSYGEEFDYNVLCSTNMLLKKWIATIWQGYCWKLFKHQTHIDCRVCDEYVCVYDLVCSGLVLSIWSSICRSLCMSTTSSGICMHFLNYLDSSTTYTLYIVQCRDRELLVMEFLLHKGSRTHWWYCIPTQTFPYIEIQNSIQSFALKILHKKSVPIFDQ